MKLYPGVQEQVALAPFNTTGVGGPARYFYRATTREGLLGVLDWAEQNGIHYIVIGHGSNLLAPDEGVDGLVIKNEVNSFKIEEEAAKVTVEAGAPLLPFINQLAQLGWGGFENLAGVPGTVGGAIWGNAGCYGATTSDWVESVLVRQEGGKLVDIPVAEMGYQYRRSMLKDHPYWAVIAATYRLQRQDPSQLRNQIRHILNRRQTDKPTGRSGGSYFKNPTLTSSAGFLIDSAGLKGRQVGGARVSSQHANFFLNGDQGTCEDVLNLAQAVKDKVYAQYRIQLEEEIILLAAKPDVATNRATDYSPRTTKT